MTFSTRLRLAVALLATAAAPALLPAQAPPRLTADMREAVRALDRIAIVPLERWSTSFWAVGVIVDSTAYRRAREFAPRFFERDTTREMIPGDMARALEVASRVERPSRATVIAIMVDSVPGGMEQGHDGADGPNLTRYTVTELQARDGRCVLLIRSYKFVKGDGGQWGFGRVAFGPERASACKSHRFWSDSLPATPPLRVGTRADLLRLAEAYVAEPDYPALRRVLLAEALRRSAGPEPWIQLAFTPTDVPWICDTGGNRDAVELRRQATALFVAGNVAAQLRAGAVGDSSAAGAEAVSEAFQRDDYLLLAARPYRATGADPRINWPPAVIEAHVAKLTPARARQCAAAP